MLHAHALLAWWHHTIDPALPGPLPIRWYGLLFATAILLGYWHLRRQFVACGDKVEDAERIFLALFLCVVFGSRLGHALFYQQELLHPIEFVQIWKGGLASHGATIAVLLGVAYCARKLGVTYITVSDRLAPGVALGSSFVRLGNFINSEIVGRPTDVPWAVVFERYRDHLPRHPTQLYEFGIGVFVYLALISVDRIYGVRTRPKGLITFLFLALYFTCRFFVEYFKEDQVENFFHITEFMNVSALTMGQWLSLPFATVGWIGAARVVYRRAKGLDAPPAPVEPPAPGAEATPPRAEKKSKKKGKKRG